MAEGFICGRGRGGKLGPLELFVDGYGRENWHTEHAHASIGKTLHASAPRGQKTQSNVISKPVVFNGISSVQFVIHRLVYETPLSDSLQSGVFFAIYDAAKPNSSPVVDRYIYLDEETVVELDVYSLGQNKKKKYEIVITATPQGTQDDYGDEKNHGPTIEVSRVSLIPN